jgi:PKD domain
MYIQAFARALTAALCCALCACAAQRSGAPTDHAVPAGQSAPTVPGGFALPAPSALRERLQVARGASYVDADLAKPGSFIRLDLPNQHVLPSDPDAEFTPDFSPPGASFDGLAFGIYVFTNLGDYDLDEVVNSTWIIAPPTGSCWIGLSNWGADRWNWFPLDENLRATITPSPGPPLDDYIDFGGALLLTVAMTGNQAASLQGLRIGTNPPQAQLSVSPSSGLAPLLVDFDASASGDSDGTVVKYEWDFDGDGVYDLESGAVATAQHSYDAPGFFSARVRVTDDIGATGTWAADVQALAEWNHTWGGAADDSGNAVLVSGDDIYFAGRLDLDSDADLVLQKYNLSGSRLWSKTWNSGGPDIAKALATSAEGNTIYLAGYTEAGDGDLYDMLLQAWDTSGNLKWTRTWGGDQNDLGNDLVVAQGGVYLCGSTSSFAVPQLPQAAILRFSESGNLIWQRSWGGSQWDECFSACVVTPLVGDQSIALAGDTNSFGAGGMDMLHLRFDLDGNLSSAQTWGDADMQTATGVVSQLSVGTFVAGWGGSPTPHGLVVRVAGGQPSFAQRYDGGVGVMINGLLYDNGDLVPVGYVNMSADYDLLAGRINIDSGNFSLARIAKSGGPQTGQCAARMPDGTFLFGGQAENNSGIIWEALNATSTDMSGIAWESVNQPAETLDVPAVSKSILPTFGGGVSDTGGGGADMFIGMHQL